MRVVAPPPPLVAVLWNLLISIRSCLIALSAFIIDEYWFIHSPEKSAWTCFGEALSLPSLIWQTSDCRTYLCFINA